MRYSRFPSYVLGFHGCDRAVAEAVFSGEKDLVASTNDYDWLGHGIYFWENDPQRAERWAIERSKNTNSAINQPAVVGAVIDLGHALNLTRSDHVGFLKKSHAVLSASYTKEKYAEMPKNSGGSDRLLRRLDCAVIQTLHTIWETGENAPFDSVRGLFLEGDEVYPTAGFRERTHVQLCIRNHNCIKGYFRPMEGGTSMTGSMLRVKTNL